MSADVTRDRLGQSEHASKLCALEQLALRPTDSTELLAAAKSAAKALSVGLPDQYLGRFTIPLPGARSAWAWLAASCVIM